MNSLTLGGVSFFLSFKIKRVWSSSRSLDISNYLEGLQNGGLIKQNDCLIKQND